MYLQHLRKKKSEDELNNIPTFLEQDQWEWEGGLQELSHVRAYLVSMMIWQMLIKENQEERKGVLKALAKQTSPFFQWRKNQVINGNKRTFINGLLINFLNQAKLDQEEDQMLKKWIEKIYGPEYSPGSINGSLDIFEQFIVSESFLEQEVFKHLASLAQETPEIAKAKKDKATEQLRKENKRLEETRLTLNKNKDKRERERGSPQKQKETTGEATEPSRLESHYAKKVAKLKVSVRESEKAMERYNNTISECDKIINQDTPSLASNECQSSLARAFYQLQILNDVGRVVTQNPHADVWNSYVNEQRSLLKWAFFGFLATLASLTVLLEMRSRNPGILGFSPNPRNISVVSGLGFLWSGWNFCRWALKTPSSLDPTPFEKETTDELGIFQSQMEALENALPPEEPEENLVEEAEEETEGTSENHSQKPYFRVFSQGLREKLNKMQTDCHANIRAINDNPHLLSLANDDPTMSFPYGNAVRDSVKIHGVKFSPRS